MDKKIKMAVIHINNEINKLQKIKGWLQRLESGKIYEIVLSGGQVRELILFKGFVQQDTNKIFISYRGIASLNCGISSNFSLYDVKYVLYMKHVLVKDLPLYVNFKYKTFWWDRLLKRAYGL